MTLAHPTHPEAVTAAVPPLALRQQDLHRSLLAALQAGDQEAANRLRWVLVDTVEGFIHARVSSWRRRQTYTRLELADFLSTVRLYVAESLEKWNPRSCNLATFTRYKIQDALVGPASAMADTLYMGHCTRRDRRRLQGVLRQGFTVEDFAAGMGGKYTAKTATRLLTPLITTSADAPIRPGSRSLLDVLSAPEETPQEERTGLPLFAIESALSCLPPRDRKIMALRYGLLGQRVTPMSVICAHVGLHKRTVQTATARSLQRLRVVVGAS